MGGWTRSHKNVIQKTGTPAPESAVVVVASSQIRPAAGYGGVIGRFRCRGGYGADLRVRVQAIEMMHLPGGEMGDWSKVTAYPA